MLQQTDQQLERQSDRTTAPLPFPMSSPAAARATVTSTLPGFPSPLAAAILGDQPSRPIPRLSPRETECLEWTAQGKTTWEIAQILCLSDSTVNYYIRNAMKKLAVHTKAHAVSKAAVLGMFG
ncbi:MAG: helix-turn-helix domain-containing protein [Alphaproteobacteria bacterium]